MDKKKYNTLSRSKFGIEEIEYCKILKQDPAKPACRQAGKFGMSAEASV